MSEVKPKRPFAYSLDLLGKTFNLLTVIDRVDSPANEKAIWYQCICACGNETTGRGSEIYRGRKKSCGCDNWKSKYKPFRSHPLYEVWHSMMQRCNNPNHKAFHRYGGRGIIVCPEWHDYEKFYSDNISIYIPKMVFDRIENDGNYVVGNVRFVTYRVSGRNKCNTKLSESIVAEIKSSKEKPRLLGIKYGVTVGTIHQIQRGERWG